AEDRRLEISALDRNRRCLAENRNRKDSAIQVAGGAFLQVVMRSSIAVRGFTTNQARLSPPLWGRVGEGGITNSSAFGLPPSLTLPHKGGGNDRASRKGAHRVVRRERGHV